MPGTSPTCLQYALEAGRCGQGKVQTGKSARGAVTQVGGPLPADAAATAVGSSQQRTRQGATEERALVDRVDGAGGAQQGSNARNGKDAWKEGGGRVWTSGFRLE